ncbi:MAG: molybdopterin dinucleotide binding domain-containing protein, partial [Candidatus Korobacteraceae bacterium]
DRGKLEREGHVRLNLPEAEPTRHEQPKTSSAESLPPIFLPFVDGAFPTSSGKAELYSSQLAEAGLDPVASFVPPRESRHGQLKNRPAARSYPLELLARKADNYLNSTFCNQPEIRDMEAQELLEISAVDAHARGIADGDRVRVKNERGEILLTASVQANGSSAVQPGVVAARLNWAKLSQDGRNVNVLTSQRLTDMGDSATFYSALVEVEKG